MWLLAGVSQLKRMIRNTHKGRWTSCLGEEDVINISLHHLETINWGMKFLYYGWLSKNKEVA